MDILFVFDEFWFWSFFVVPENKAMGKVKVQVYKEPSSPSRMQVIMLYCQQ